MKAAALGQLCVRAPLDDIGAVQPLPHQAPCPRVSRPRSSCSRSSSAAKSAASRRAATNSPARRLRVGESIPARVYEAPISREHEGVGRARREEPGYNRASRGIARDRGKHVGDTPGRTKGLLVAVRMRESPLIVSVQFGAGAARLLRSKFPLCYFIARFN